MAQKVTLSPDFMIRPLEGSAEIDMFYRLAVATFNPYDDPEEAAPRTRRLVEDAPGFEPHQQRGAFLGKTFLGGYLIIDRTICIGSARLHTGCIADVVTLAEHRNRGIATALLQDAINYAYTYRHALLLLDGIPNFYHRFGFVDVLDICKHLIDSNAIQYLSPGSYQLRPATPDDTVAMLALYQRHYGTRTGSFVRDLAQQEHFLRWRYKEPPLLVVNSDNVPHGYIKLVQRPQQVFAYEVAADNWHAAVALLQYHAAIQAQVNAADTELTWFLPVDAPTVDLLADHVTVHSHLLHVPNADWMACPVHIPTLFQAMLPCWNERWLPCSQLWSGSIEWQIGDVTNTLLVDTHGLRLTEQLSAATKRIRMSPQVLTQLLFGYRSIVWATQQTGQHIPKELFPFLQVLFPRGYAWINGTDAF